MGGIEGIVGFAAVPEREVKIAVRAEDGVARVVIPEGLRDFKENAFAIGLGLAGLFTESPFGKAGAFRVLQSVVEVKLLVFGELGVENEPKKTFFESVADHVPLGEVEKSFGFGGVPVLGEDEDFSALKDEEFSARRIGRQDYAEA